MLRMRGSKSFFYSPISSLRSVYPPMSGAESAECKLNAAQSSASRTIHVLLCRFDDGTDDRYGGSEDSAIEPKQIFAVCDTNHRVDAAVQLLKCQSKAEHAMRSVNRPWREEQLECEIETRNINETIDGDELLPKEARISEDGQPSHKRRKLDQETEGSSVADADVPHAQKRDGDEQKRDSDEHATMYYLVRYTDKNRDPLDRTDGELWAVCDSVQHAQAARQALVTASESEYAASSDAQTYGAGVWSERNLAIIIEALPLNIAIPLRQAIPEKPFASAQAEEEHDQETADDNSDEEDNDEDNGEDEEQASSEPTR